MGLWNTHGMTKYDEDLKMAIDAMGLIPDELSSSPTTQKISVGFTSKWPSMKKGRTSAS